MRDLQQQWRQAADVPRAQGETLWRRFKAAHDEVWTRCEAHFAAQAEARAENLAKKIALANAPRRWPTRRDWIQTADEIKKLQADWKTIGPVSRGQEKAIWDRFRTACDRFFTRRHADLAERKTVWAENLAKKEALCVRAEALAESTDWEPAAAEIKRLQAEWKTIGPVKKTRVRSDLAALPRRLRSRSSRATRSATTSRASERVAAREAIVQPSSRRSPASVRRRRRRPSRTARVARAEPPADLLATVRSLRGRWQQELARAASIASARRALDTRFAAAFARRDRAVARGVRRHRSRSRREPKADGIARAAYGGSREIASPARRPRSAMQALSPTTRLAAMLKEALAANTIGGKVDEDSRFRAAAEEVRQAQAAWSRIGPVPDDARRALADRFQRALRVISRAGSGGWRQERRVEKSEGRR